MAPAVEAARAEGIPWAKIGSLLGTSAQAANSATEVFPKLFEAMLLEVSPRCVVPAGTSQVVLELLVQGVHEDLVVRGPQADCQIRPNLRRGQSR